MRDHYDANMVANESAGRAEHDPPALCDCGAAAEPGRAYCRTCAEAIGLTMRKAAETLRRDCEFSEDEAEEAICRWLENPEEFKEEENAETIQRTAANRRAAVL